MGQRMVGDEELLVDGGFPRCRTTGEGERQERPKTSTMKGAKAVVDGESGASSMWPCLWSSSTVFRLRLRSMVEVGGTKLDITIMPSKSTVDDVDREISWKLIASNPCFGNAD